MGTGPDRSYFNAPAPSGMISSVAARVSSNTYDVPRTRLISTTERHGREFGQESRWHAHQAHGPIFFLAEHPSPFSQNRARRR